MVGHLLLSHVTSKLLVTALFIWVKRWLHSAACQPALDFRSTKFVQSLFARSTD